MESNVAIINETPIVSVRSLLEIRRTSPRYKDTPADARQAWLLNQLAMCNTMNHTRLDPQTLKVDTAALDAVMMKDPVIADFTAPEISFALFHGTMGEYGEYYGLTPRTVMGFFREFLKTDVKYCATAEEKKAAQPERGSWVLERMEHHRQQVEREWREKENQAVPENREEGWKKHIETILNTKNTQ